MLIIHTLSLSFSHIHTHPSAEELKNEREMLTIHTLSFSLTHTHTLTHTHPSVEERKNEREMQYLDQEQKRLEVA